MRELFERLRQMLAGGEDAVLCTITESDGSTPRGAGAQMLVTGDGAALGTVGGGAAEHLVCRAAQEVLCSQKSRTQRFIMRPGDGDTGMICGGGITVAMQYFPRGDSRTRELLDAALPLFDGGGELWLLTRMRSDGDWQTGLYDTEHGVRFLPEADLPSVRAALDGRGDGALYAAPLKRGGTVWIFGGGHVAAELAAALIRVDFRTAIWEDRPEFADPARFPGAAEVVWDSYSAVGRRLALRPWDCAAIMTNGHQADFEVLRQILPMEPGYVGCIGSRGKHAAICRRLRESGFSEADIARIHSPIGLPILARTPAEIAVSITAELIAHRAAGQTEHRRG